MQIRLYIILYMNEKEIEAKRKRKKEETVHEKNWNTSVECKKAVCYGIVFSLSLSVQNTQAEKNRHKHIHRFDIITSVALNGCIQYIRIHVYICIILKHYLKDASAT